MTTHFLKWSFGPKIESVDGICEQTDSRNRFYLDVKTGPYGCGKHSMIFILDLHVLGCSCSDRKKMKFLNKGGIRCILRSCRATFFVCAGPHWSN